MPDFLFPASAGAQEDVDDLRDHSVIVIAGNPRLRLSRSFEADRVDGEADRRAAQMEQARRFERSEGELAP